MFIQGRFLPALLFYSMILEYFKSLKGSTRYGHSKGTGLSGEAVDPKRLP
jgi:hypothetical protein